MKLCQTKHQVKLQKRYLKVMHILPSYDNTFVMIAMPAIGQDAIVHANFEGKILYEKVFEDLVDSINLLNENEVIFLEPVQNSISILDLRSYKWRKIPHNFMFEQTESCSLEMFYETKKMLVMQHGKYKQDFLKLSYYNYPLQGENIKPFEVFESQGDQWTYQYIIRRANTHSMIIWFKARQDDNIEIKVYDLLGKYRSYSIANTIGAQYNITSKIELAICNAWEMKKGQFCLVCTTNKGQLGGKNSKGVVNNNYIFDVGNNILRQTQFFFEGDYNEFLIDYYSFGKTSMFRCYAFENGQPLQSPVFYIDNELEEIVAEQTWFCTYKTKFFFPGSDIATFVEAEYENGNVEKIVIKYKKLKKVLLSKLIMLHFLLCMNPNFDDDLLKEALEMIDYNSE